MAQLAAVERGVARFTGAARAAGAAGMAARPNGRARSSRSTAAGSHWAWTSLSAVPAVPAVLTESRLRWASLAAVPLAAGVALLTTFVLLGRPPLSLPTLRGLTLFLPLAAALLALWELEVRFSAPLVERRTGDPTVAWLWVLAGYAPLALSWPLVGLLYLPEVHHWFVTVAIVKPAMVIAVLVPAVALKLALLAALAPQAVAGWAWRRRYLLAGGTYAAVALAAKPSLWHLDLPAWFVPAAKMVLAGRPLAMYSIRADVMGTPAPIEHGPLSVLFYAPFVAAAQGVSAAGWGLVGTADFMRLGALFPLAGVLVVDCCMAYAATRAMRDLAPRITEGQLLGAFVLILFSPLLWFSSVWLVHLESLSALLVILSLRQLRHGQLITAATAGALLGTAMLLKHSAALVLVPVCLVLFLGGARWRAVLLAATAGGVCAAGLLPFALAAPQDFAYNFFGYDEVKPIYGITIWKALYDTGLERLVMRFDSLLIGAVAVASTLALVLVTHVRSVKRLEMAWQGWQPVVEVGPWMRRECDLAPVEEDKALGLLERCWIAVVLGQMAWLGLATWQYPHYFVLGFVALLVWEMSSLAQARDVSSGDGHWPILSLLFLFVPFNLQAHLPNNVGKAGGPFVVARAMAQLLFLYGCAVAVWVRAALVAGSPALAQRSTGVTAEGQLLLELRQLAERAHGGAGAERGDVNGGALLPAKEDAQPVFSQLRA